MRVFPSMLGLLGLGLIVVAGCATVGVHTGGPPDRTAPRVVAVNPPNEQRQFRSREIVVAFNEFIQVQNPTAAVFVSPPLPVPPQVLVFNKQLIIRLDPKTLDSSLTYVITLTRALTDINENIPLARPLQYAFTTGTVIDSGIVTGRIRDALTKRGAVGLLIGLYDPDTVAAQGFFRTRPVYLAPADSQGFFQLSYLRPGRYLTLGFSDPDNSFSYTGRQEALAMDSLGYVVVPPQGPWPELDLWAFQPDTTGPALTGVTPQNRRTLRVTFDEPVEAVGLALSSDLRTPLPDRPRPQALAPVYAQRTRNEVLLFHNAELRDSLVLLASGVTDTLGNVAPDTLLRFFVRPGTPDTVLKVRVLDRERTDPLRQFEVQFTSPLDSAQLEKHVFLVDSGIRVIPNVRFLPRPFGFQVTVPEGIRPEVEPAILIDSFLLTRDSLRLPKGFYQKLSIPSESEFGTLSGRLQTTAKNLVVELVAQGSLEALQRVPGPRFAFRLVEPGLYYLRVVVDEDGNGRWTPGRLDPRREPEVVYLYPIDQQVRGGWDIEGITLPFPPLNPAQPAPDPTREGR